ncbi:MAG TPA: class I SAM-dependent methyltransferase [Gaiellaceae bacterium]|nr:class I SAM-dependent methyltransferase [Gaiellaceae bacterium]
MPERDDAAFLGIMEQAARYNDWLVERCIPHLGPRVLDFGAGSGTFVRALAAHCEELVAVEPAAEPFAELRRRAEGLPNVRAVQVLPGDERFDAIVCLNVLEHLDDDVATLRDLRGCLTQDGRLLVLVPAHPPLFGPLDRSVGHRRRYTKAALRAVLERADFRVRDLRLVNPLGALGWLVAGRLAGRAAIPGAPLRVYDRVVPLVRRLDRVDLPVGLSAWAVAAPA